jgi:1A family penicillin-binding protein
VFRSLLILCVIVGVAGLIWYGRAIADLPSIGHLENKLSIPSSYVYDRQGRLLVELLAGAEGKHAPLPLERIPRALRQAVLATEDASFYYNPGFSPRGIVRSAWLNLRSGYVVAGGSTITQQLVRNLFMEPAERYDQTLERKAREATLAVRLTARHSKDEILALYLNQTYFGNFAYGVDAAAQAYFGAPAEELDLAQCALLAGLVQSPALYNPYTHGEAALQRQRVVLNLMARHGYLTPAEADLAAGEPLHFAASPFPIEAPHFAMYVADILERELGTERLRQGNLRVYTTLDLDMQRAAELTARRRLEELNRKDGEKAALHRRVDNAAVVALEPASGEIVVLVGSPDYFDAHINGAVNAALALRQPGSSLKPFTYAAAFEADYTPATLLLDVRSTFMTKEGLPYVPQNYDLQYHGPVLARQALASSFNVPAVKTLDHIGVERLAELTSRLGLSSFEGAARYGLSLTLGGGEVSLLELSVAYAGLAAGGRQVEPIAVRRVEDGSGRVLRAWQGGPSVRVLSPQTAYLITDILSDDQARIAGFGEGSALRLSRPAAAKTGTTTDWRDNWVVGYTPDLVAGVWVGNADNTPMYNVSGISGAGPIWHDFMEEALLGRPVREFSRPDGLIEADICSVSGLAPGPDCPLVRTEMFVAGSEPHDVCTMHQRVRLDRATGELATADTPAERIMEQVYLILPAEAQEWAAEQGVPRPPIEGGLAGRAPAMSEEVLTLTSPDAGTIYQLSAALPRTEQRVALAARSADGVRFTAVELWVDGEAAARFSAGPYETRWVLEPGTHTFLARGRTIDGQWVESRPVQVVVRE